jgi:hypothetical protein
MKRFLLVFLTANALSVFGSPLFVADNPVGGTGVRKALQCLKARFPRFGQPVGTSRSDAIEQSSGDRGRISECSGPIKVGLHVDLADAFTVL